MKWRVLQFVFFLLAGAIANVAEAWLFQWRTPSSAMSGPIMVSSEQGQSAMPVHADAETAPITGVTGSTWVGPGRTEFSLQAFHREQTEEGHIRYANQLSVWHAGWPLRSLQCSYGIGQQSVETRRYGYWQAPWMSRGSGARVESFVLPFVPRWPGFVVNTFFYAGLLWLMLVGPLVARRWQRIRRGRCPTCAYPVGSSQLCTECGKPVTKRQTPQLQ